MNENSKKNGDVVGVLSNKEMPSDNEFGTTKKLLTTSKGILVLE